MTRPKDFLSESVQTRIVELLCTEEEPPTLRRVDGDGKTRFEFAPDDD